MTQINLRRVRDEAPENAEFLIEEYTLVAELDGDAGQLVWVRAILERTAIVEREFRGHREVVNLGRLTIPEERIPASYVPTHDPVTGIKIVSAEAGRERGRETQRRMRAEAQATRREVGAQPEVAAAACG